MRYVTSFFIGLGFGTLFMLICVGALPFLPFVIAYRIGEWCRREWRVNRPKEAELKRKHPCFHLDCEELSEPGKLYCEDHKPEGDA